MATEGERGAKHLPHSLVRFSKIFWKLIGLLFARIIVSGEEPYFLRELGETRGISELLEEIDAIIKSEPSSGLIDEE